MGLMNPDPEQRLAADQALKSDWFKKAIRGDLKKKDLNQTLDHLKAFNAGGAFKQAMQSFFSQLLIS